MKYSQRFLTFKGYSATSMFLGQPGICQFTSLNFHIIPNRFPWCLPGGETISRSHPGKFLKIFHFPRWVKQSPPGYWGRILSCCGALMHQAKHWTESRNCKRTRHDQYLFFQGTHWKPPSWDFFFKSRNLNEK